MSIMGQHSLRHRPVYASGTEQRPSPLMVEPAGGLELTTERGVEVFSYGGDPIDDRRLHPFGIVGTSSVHALLYLHGDNGGREANVLAVGNMKYKLTRSVSNSLSSSDAFTSLSSRLGQSLSSSMKTCCSRHSLMK